MTHKCYRLTPEVRAITDLVSDEQMQAVFDGTNFGHTDFRGLLAQGCIKALQAGTKGTRSPAYEARLQRPPRGLILSPCPHRHLSR
jgi:hypothetical protein